MRTNLRRTGALALALTIFTVFAEKDKSYTYLALGDSIAFGFDPRVFVPGAPHPEPGSFVGYPELVVAGLPAGSTHINAACPGETSGSLIIVGAPDNGCNGPGPQGQPPFKTSIGLHADYKKNRSQFTAVQNRGQQMRHVLKTWDLGRGSGV